MARLPEAMPRTLSAAHHIRRHARQLDARRRAGDLFHALVAVECHFTVGGPAGVPAGLLRDLVMITTGLVGRTWLDASSDQAAAFTSLHASPAPPPLAELDQILATLLSGRFSLSAAEPAA